MKFKQKSKLLVMPPLVAGLFIPAPTVNINTYNLNSFMKVSAVVEEADGGTLQQQKSTFVNHYNDLNLRPENHISSNLPVSSI